MANARAHLDFILPGLRNNPTAVRKWMLALAYAYSRRWNPRRLEYHFYGIWNRVFSHLTDDQETLIIIPQSLIYYVDSPRNIADISIGTFAEPDANDIVPDFAVAHVHYSWRQRVHTPDDLASLVLWDAMIVQYVGIPILVEVKRPPSRNLKGVDFQAALSSYLNDAIADLERQASHLFADHTRASQKSVILIGCSGEWWRWRVATRDDFQEYEKLGVLDEEEDEYDDGEDEDRVYVSKTAIQEEYDSDPLNIESMTRITDIGEDEASELGDAEEAWATEEWSLSLRLGTPASNQRLYLIHRRLSEVVIDARHRDG
jgi:hypothetical protein